MYDPFEIVPLVTTKLNDKVLLFSDANEQTVNVGVRSGANNIKGKLFLDVPEEWKVTPTFIEIEIKQKGDTQTYPFKITPNKLLMKCLKICHFFLIRLSYSNKVIKPIFAAHL